MKSTKTNCVLVHGWAMNRAVWRPLISHFPETLKPLAIDLPGHGLRFNESFQSLQDLVDDLDRNLDQAAVVVAWSLAGLAALELAIQRPEKVRALVLVASSPCFVQRDDWPSAMPAEVFDDFANGLEQDFSGTIRRFLSLQVRGSDSGRKLLRQLRQEVLEQPEPNMDALRHGLELLKTVDLRQRLEQLRLPVLWCLGGQDGLVKSSLSRQLSSLLPDVKLRVYPKAAHAPFLSHRDQFLQDLAEFVEEINDKAQLQRKEAD